MSGRLRAPTADEQDWIALSDELAPAKSLVRLDAANTRVTTSIAIIGVLVSAVGVASIELGSVGPAVRGLVFVTVVSASLAVVLALSGQILSITKEFNRHDLDAVRRWFERRVRWRAPLARAAGALLILSALSAGAAGAAQVVDQPLDAPGVTLSRVSAGPSSSSGAGQEPQDLVVVSLTYSGLAPGDQVLILVESGDAMLATVQGIVGHTGDGAEVIEVSGVPRGAGVSTTVTAGPWTCELALGGAESATRAAEGSCSDGPVPAAGRL